MFKSLASIIFLKDLSFWFFAQLHVRVIQRQRIKDYCPGPNTRDSELIGLVGAQALIFFFK